MTRSPSLMSRMTLQPFHASLAIAGRGGDIGSSFNRESELTAICRRAAGGSLYVYEDTAESPIQNRIRIRFQLQLTSLSITRFGFGCSMVLNIGALSVDGLKVDLR